MISEDAYEDLHALIGDRFENKEQMLKLEKVLTAAIMSHMDWDHSKVKRWLTTKNLHFGGIEPLKLILFGRGHKLVDWVLNAIDESTPPNVWPWGEPKDQKSAPVLSDK